MSPKIASIVDSVEGLTLLEVSELVSALKVGVWGVGVEEKGRGHKGKRKSRKTCCPMRWEGCEGGQSKEWARDGGRRSWSQLVCDARASCSEHALASFTVSPCPRPSIIWRIFASPAEALPLVARQDDHAAAA